MARTETLFPTRSRVVCVVLNGAFHCTEAFQNVASNRSWTLEHSDITTTLAGGEFRQRHVVPSGVRESGRAGADHCHSGRLGEIHIRVNAIARARFPYGEAHGLVIHRKNLKSTPSSTSDEAFLQTRELTNLAHSCLAIWRNTHWGVLSDWTLSIGCAAP